MGVWLSYITTVLLAAHGTFASVAGTVRDEESGAPLPGVIVSLIDLDRSVLTDSAGRYLLPEVPAGPQHVMARRIGYARQTFHALVPRQGTLEINIALRPEPISLQGIDVRSSVPVRGVEGGEGAAYPDRGLSAAAVRNHPLLSEPDALQAAGGGEVVLRPESPSGIHVRGGASDQIAYLLDGIPVFSPYHAAGTFSAWNPDALSRLDLLTSSSTPALPDAASGVVSATTRVPGSQLHTQGGVSTTQARVTIDGPIGGGGVGYLLSLRSAFPGLLFHRNEPSYLRGESADWLGKIESPLFAGRLRLLSYGNEDEIQIAAAAQHDTMPQVDRARNVLGWDGSSHGGEWTRPFRRGSFHLRAWTAGAHAVADWTGQDSLSEHLVARRRDQGLLAMVEFTGGERRTAAGFRTQWSRTTYRLTPLAGEGRSMKLSARTPVSAAFVQHERSLSRRTEIELSLSTALAADDVHPSPGAQLRWKPTDRLTVTGGYSRRHQFAQSLRNSESVISNIFPVDLYLGAARGGVPVVRSDLGLVALEHRPTAGVRLAAQGYARGFDSLVLVAARDGDPFTSTGFAEGSGEAHGFALDAAASGARYGFVASYGFQRVHFEYADTSYVPEHGVRHSIAGGLIVFPSPTSNVRIGFESLLGRRTAAVLGPFEWEACNLLDQGCEIAGSPGGRTEGLGMTRLPAYVRVDVGLRKHWHVQAGGRDAEFGVFGTMTNLLNRKNVLTVAVDPVTGERTQIEMRPRSPLVVGVDWRF